jgi:hypothetical protein
MHIVDQSIINVQFTNIPICMMIDSMLCRSWDKRKQGIENQPLAKMTSTGDKT